MSACGSYRIDWNAVSAIASAISALAAAGTVGMTVHYWKTSDGDRTKERQQDFTDRWIVTPAQASVESFVVTSARLVSTMLPTVITRYEANAPASELDALVSTIVDSITAEYLQMRRLVLFRARGVLEGKRLEEVVSALDVFQERFSRSFDKPSKLLQVPQVVAEIESAAAQFVKATIDAAMRA